MKIRNNTSKKLHFYFGNPTSETPTADFILEVGAEFETDNCPDDSVSIQEK